MRYEAKPDEAKSWMMRPAFFPSDNTDFFVFTSFSLLTSFVPVIIAVFMRFAMNSMRLQCESRLSLLLHTIRLKLLSASKQTKSRLNSELCSLSFIPEYSVFAFDTEKYKD